MVEGAVPCHAARGGRPFCNLCTFAGFVCISDCSHVVSDLLRAARPSTTRVSVAQDPQSNVEQPGGRCVRVAGVQSPAGRSRRALFVLYAFFNSKMLEILDNCSNNT